MFSVQMIADHKMKTDKTLKNLPTKMIQSPNRYIPTNQQ